MKKPVITLLLCIFGMVSSVLANKLTVTAGILPLQYFVEQIGGDLVSVNVMVKPGADPHTYEPLPSQMVALSRSTLYFAVGVEFEKVWLRKFQAANPGLRIVQTNEEITQRLSRETEHHGEEHIHDHDNDPHIWLSPLRAKKMALKIFEALSKTDPKNRNRYKANHQRFQAKLNSLYTDLQKLFPPNNKATEFLVFHPSWGHFAKAFNLRQLAIEAEGKSPKPAQLKNIIQHAKEKGIKVVFVQPRLSGRNATVIAKAIGGSIIPIDPLAGNWEENLRVVANQIKRAIR